MLVLLMIWLWVSSQFSLRKNKLLWQWLWLQQLHLCQHWQYEKLGGEDSETPVLEIHLQAVQGCSSIRHFLLNLYVHLQGAFPSSGYALHATYHTDRSSVRHGHELFHHLQTWLMQCVPGTAKEVLRKLQIRLPHMTHPCLSRCTAAQQLVEQWEEYRRHSTAKPQKESKEGSRSSLGSL